MGNMYQTNDRPSRRWVVLLLPLLLAAGLIATFVGVWLYSGATAPPVNSTTVRGFWWFPLFIFFIPISFFLIFFAVRWYFWGGGWWWWGGRGWYYRGGYYYDPALETLRERYAKGEITLEQYEQMRRDLERREQQAVPAR